MTISRVQNWIFDFCQWGLAIPFLLPFWGVSFPFFIQVPKFYIPPVIAGLCPANIHWLLVLILAIDLLP